MKLIVSFSVLVAVVASTSITFRDGIDLDNTAYGYLSKVGFPLANKIREAETKSANDSVAELKVDKILEPSLKIFSGYAARLGEIPYQAGLLVDFRRGNSVCGGSLLNANRVLTAAHCWWDGINQATSLVVVLGSVKLFTGGTRLQTSTVIMHRRWNPRVLQNDIAMVYLPTSVQFSNTIQPIALPPRGMLSQSFNQQTVVASGYGLTRDHGVINHNTFLSYVPLQVITNEQCSRSYGYILPSVICTWGHGYKNICGGDSGGPLTMTSNNKRFLIGVASFGSKSCEEGSPAAFTRVTYFIDWIVKYLQ